MLSNLWRTTIPSSSALSLPSKKQSRRPLTTQMGRFVGQLRPAEQNLPGLFRAGRRTSDFSPPSLSDPRLANSALGASEPPLMRVPPPPSADANFSLLFTYFRCFPPKRSRGGLPLPTIPPRSRGPPVSRVSQPVIPRPPIPPGSNPRNRFERVDRVRPAQACSQTKARRSVQTTNLPHQRDLGSWGKVVWEQLTLRQWAATEQSLTSKTRRLS